MNNQVSVKLRIFYRSTMTTFLQKANSRHNFRDDLFCSRHIHTQTFQRTFYFVFVFRWKQRLIKDKLEVHQDKSSHDNVFFNRAMLVQSVKKKPIYKRKIFSFEIVLSCCSILLVLYFHTECKTDF